MGNKSPTGILLAAITWLMVAAGIAAAYRYFLHPTLNRRLESATGSASRYRHDLRVAADSFSGYALLRSDALRDELRRHGIQWTVRDDGGDTFARLSSMERGDVEAAVFTIDSLLASGARLGAFPGSIVLIVDESKGADAIVAYRDGAPSLDALNDPSARFVATPHSPSEFLVRVALANFNLQAVGNDWLQPEDGAERVYYAFRAAPTDARRAFALWEPWVSRARAEPGVAVLLDSARLSGYIMDVLVFRRDVLRDHEPVVRTVVESYLRVVHDAHRSGRLVDLVMEDARRSGGQPIPRDQADQLVQGIAWRNTIENYAQFGLIDPPGGDRLPHLEDAIARIADVLVRTGAVAADPVDGRAHVLFYDKVLRDLKDARFHPGRPSGDPAGGDALDFESVRAERRLAALTDAEWDLLTPVAEMRIDPISFARGAARLNVSSERGLRALAGQLEALPRYYLTVAGQARPEGDPEANLRLARARAEAVRAFLVSGGMNPDRIRAVTIESDAAGGAAQVVSFRVGQLPY